MVEIRLQICPCVNKKKALSLKKILTKIDLFQKFHKYLLYIRKRFKIFVQKSSAMNIDEFVQRIVSLKKNKKQLAKEKLASQKKMTKRP